MQGFKNILCVAPTNGSSDAAFERAATLAKDNQSRLTIVKVVDELSPDEGGEALAAVIDPWRSNIEIDFKVLEGKVFLEVVQQVLRNGHDLVVKVAQSSGLRDRVFGSDDISLLRKCPCPVWLINSKAPKTYSHVMAAIDVGDFYSPQEIEMRYLLNTQILEIADSLTISDAAALHAVHVLELFGESAVRYEASESQSSVGEINLKLDTDSTTISEVDAYAEELRQQHRQNLDTLVNEVIEKTKQNAHDTIKLETNLLIGSPRKKLPAFAKASGVDMVVIGTESRGGIPGIFVGNTAETIFHRLGCSVLAVKPPGFVSPVTLEEPAPLNAVG